MCIHAQWSLRIHSNGFCLTRGDLNRDIFIYERRPQICEHKKRARIHTHTQMAAFECVRAYLKHKHSLCIKSDSIDGDDDGGVGSGGSSSNNLSINQVYYSLHRICRKIATITNTRQSIG